MWFTCRCGVNIHDMTDGLSNKGYLLADQDYNTPGEHPDDGAGPFAAAHRLSRSVYQCDDCGRLYIDDRERGLLAFAPEGGRHANALGSVHGRCFPVTLHAGWNEAGPAPDRGNIFWDPAGDLPGGYERFSDLAAVKARYIEVKKTLIAEGRLRNARLMINGQIRDKWPT